MNNNMLAISCKLNMKQKIISRKVGRRYFKIK